MAQRTETEFQAGERVILRGLVWTVREQTSAGVRIYKKDKATSWRMTRKIVRPRDLKRVS